jgi:hypothetical protein
MTRGRSSISADESHLHTRFPRTDPERRRRRTRQRRHASAHRPRADAGRLWHRRGRAPDRRASRRWSDRRAAGRLGRGALWRPPGNRRRGADRRARHRADAIHLEPMVMGGVACTLRRGADAALHDQRSMGQPARRRRHPRPGHRDLRDHLHPIPDVGPGPGEPDRRFHARAFPDVRRDLPARLADARQYPQNTAHVRRS